MHLFVLSEFGKNEPVRKRALFTENFDEPWNVHNAKKEKENEDKSTFILKEMTPYS